MKEVLMTLLLWINQQTGLTFNEHQLPDVQQVPNSQLALIMFSGDIPIGYNEDRLLGLYDHDRGIIYISDGIDLDSTYGKSVVLHELVHHLQFVHKQNEKVTCRKSLERLAYELQHQYLLEHGEKAAFSLRHIELKSQCAA